MSRTQPPPSAFVTCAAASLLPEIKREICSSSLGETSVGEQIAKLAFKTTTSSSHFYSTLNHSIVNWTMDNVVPKRFM